MEKTTFEIACQQLGIAPALPTADGLSPGAAKRMIAEYQLDIIEQATNNGWQPDFSDYSQDKYTAFMVWSPSSGCFVFHNTYCTDTGTYLSARFWFPDARTARKFYTENEGLINVLHTRG